jgi:hypothetical protein
MNVDTQFYFLTYNIQIILRSFRQLPTEFITTPPCLSNKINTSFFEFVVDQAIASYALIVNIRLIVKQLLY